MIRKLRAKFIAIAMFSVAGVLLLYSVFVLGETAVSNINDIKDDLTYLTENNGVLPEPVSISDIKSNSSDNVKTADYRYSRRFFTVTLDSSGAISSVDLDNISAITDEAGAEDYALKAYKLGVSFGHSGDYYYQMTSKDDGSTLIIFLDCTEKMTTFRQMRSSAFLLILMTVVLVFIPVWLFSGKAIKPEIENAEKQKQFITNASHELKTPLAVIRANTELVEVMYGENEWSQNTLKQVDRMNDLIKDLVVLARYEEQRENMVYEDVDLSAVVRDASDSFKAVAEQKELKFDVSAEPDIHLKADAGAMKQLVTILLDNAVKYCDDGGEIAFTLARRGRNICLTSSNTFAAGKDEDYSRYFERFYRADESHKIDNKGGYGIGLSIAESVVKSHHGTIKASWRDGRIYFDVVF